MTITLPRYLVLSLQIEVTYLLLCLCIALPMVIIYVYTVPCPLLLISPIFSYCRYCTDEMLLREMMSNPLLSTYGVIIIDDVYERFVSTDVLLAFLRDILLTRPELKVVIITPPELSSKIVSYYGNVPLIEVESTYSAEVVYTSAVQRDYFHAALRLLFEIHHTQEKGDIVVFLACEQVSGCGWVLGYIYVLITWLLLLCKVYRMKRNDILYDDGTWSFLQGFLHSCCHFLTICVFNFFCIVCNFITV